MKTVCMMIFENYHNTQPGHREATTLQNANYDVTIICNKGHNQRKHEILDDVQVIRIDSEKYNLWSKLKYLYFFIKAAVIGIRLNANIYHCHDLLTIIPGFIAAKITHAKIIYHSNELNLDTIGLYGRVKERFIWKIVETTLINRVDTVITLNESIASTLVERYNLNTYPSVIRNIPKLPEYNFRGNDLFRTKWNIEPSTKIVLYQGGLIKGRGLIPLIKSVQFFDNSICLVILGNGYLKSELIKLSKRLNLSHKIYFHDYVKGDNLLEYTSSADIGIITYQKMCLNYYFVLPNKFFEYIIAGIPIIGSNFPELKKYIHSHNLGMGVDPENPEEIAATIKHLLYDSNRYNTIKQNCIKAAQRYNWQNESKKLLTIYHKLI